eukprot:TRINITY_DN87104_c0_g1_i1.p1 TRINITY_DN87104_c0_g1~~TRINITY_DN87104_c0_g1_i1.p1  ORF type:complete len:512 (+),score=63.95 TRINITY_DN87104_c0_g1_i1:141-1676(+)
MAQKLYGHNQVFCEGRFISGPDARSSILSVMMVVIPAILWQVFPGVYFLTEVSFLVPLVALGLTMSSVTLLLATAFSDPGIVPRQKDFTEHYDEKQKVFRTREPQRFYDLVLRGQPFKLKYCKTCNIYRPPRCTHCSVCENCVERFDHHCPWLGNCIGKRNYWLFYSFVTATGALNVLVLATSLAHLGLLCVQIQKDDGSGAGGAFGQAIVQAPMSLALSIYSVGIVWFTFGLCMYHNYLVATNQTTYEQIKGAFADSANPFNRGVIGNYKDVLLSQVRPRYFNGFTGRLLWPPKGAAGLAVALAPARKDKTSEEEWHASTPTRPEAASKTTGSEVELQQGPRGGAQGSPSPQPRKGRPQQEESSAELPPPLPHDDRRFELRMEEHNREHQRPQSSSQASVHRRQEDARQASDSEAAVVPRPPPLPPPADMLPQPQPPPEPKRRPAEPQQQPQPPDQEPLPPPTSPSRTLGEAVAGASVSQIAPPASDPREVDAGEDPRPERDRKHGGHYL